MRYKYKQNVIYCCAYYPDHIKKHKEPQRFFAQFVLGNEHFSFFKL